LKSFPGFDHTQALGCTSLYFDGSSSSWGGANSATAIDYNKVVALRDFSSPNEFDTAYENYSFQKSKARVEDSFLRLVFEEMERFFPQKEFISHYVLCKSCLKECVPFGEEWSPNPSHNTYNLYQLLFHYRGGHIKPRILE
jgi:hypothetical protein